MKTLGKTGATFDITTEQAEAICAILGVDPDRTTEITIKPLKASVLGISVHVDTEPPCTSLHDLVEGG